MEQTERDRQNWTGRTRQTKMDMQNKIARNQWGRTARTELPGQNF
jgi:hypothetical protein